MEEKYTGNRELAVLLRDEVERYNRGKWGKGRCYLSSAGVCCLYGGMEQKREFAARLADMLMERGLYLIAKEYIFQEMPYLKDEEVKYLSRVVKSYFVHYSTKDPTEYREELYRRLYGCLVEGGTLNLGGFVQFRMQDYLRRIGLCLGDAVDSMVHRYERELYTENLKEVIDRKGQMGFSVYLHFSARRGVVILDEEGRRVAMNAAEEEKAKTCGLGEEDIALCCLLALNPSKIHLLNSPGALYGSFFSLLCDVFHGRVNPPMAES